ncbi:MAG: hypothetical protein E4H25_02645 [Methanomassiliicoccus sp.]|nr:MAG: hypothetical protein E4H25_02645 [Methanomassiliicoccus sp.]
MKRFGATAVALVMLMTMGFTAIASAEQSEYAGGGSGGQNGDRPDVPGSFQLDQSVIFGEKVIVDGVVNGIYMDGTLIPIDVPYTNDLTGNTWDMYCRGASVMADWSDNLVLHEWEAGDKIRTEVILQDEDLSDLTVFTITAHFDVDVLNDDGIWENIWNGTTADGLWEDGQTDTYSAEVNQVGTLLYGFNWDTRSMGCDAGTYRLTFTLVDVSETYPSYDLYEDEALVGSYPIVYNTYEIVGNVDETVNPDNFLVDIDSSLTSTWIVVELL